MRRMPSSVAKAGGPGSTRRESKRPGRGTRMGRRAGWPGRRCTSHEPSWVISIRRSAVVSISTGSQWTRSSEVAAKQVPSPQYIQNRPSSRSATSAPSTTWVTTAPLFDQRASCAVPPKAGPCLVHVRRSREVGDAEHAGLSVEGGVEADEVAVGRGDDTRVLAAAGPLEGPPRVVRREQHRLGVGRERDAVIAHREAEAGGAGEGSVVVLGSEEEVDLPVEHDGAGVEDVLGRPGDLVAGDRTSEAEVGLRAEDDAVVPLERAERPGVGGSHPVSMSVGRGRLSLWPSRCAPRMCSTMSAR